MRFISMTNGAVSHLVGVSDSVAIDRYTKLGYTPEKTANGKIRVIDPSENITSETVKNILGNLDDGKEDKEDDAKG